MRILLFLVAVAAACGDVHPETVPATTDAGMPDSRPNPPACTMPVGKAALPVWFTKGGFSLEHDPAGGDGWAWRANGPTLPMDSGFAVPYHAGDQIAGLTIEAYGNGTAHGLHDIKVFYKPDALTHYQILGKADDLGRAAAWGQITFQNFQATVLSDAGFLWVQFTVDENGYYIGQVTPGMCK